MKNAKHIFTLLVLALSFQAAGQAICSYNYRKRITFNPAQVAGPSDLSNFPALINFTTDNDLRTVANSGHVENANGYDIIFTAADGVTLLSFQLENYNATNGNFTAWVKIPSLSTTLNTDIYMYYGNAAIATDQSSSATWSGYQSVWHYQNNSFSDASPNNYASTNNGTTNQAAAVVNNGRAFSGTQWVEVTAFPNLNSNFSISAWINTTNRTTAGQRIFCDDVNNTGGYGFSLADGASGQLRFFARGSSNIILDSPNSITANNTWYYCTAVADITNNIRRIYVNGVQVASIASVGWGTDAGNTSVGGETAAGETGNRFRGALDEVRVASSALSADWILTEYNNQSSPSTFYSVSTEPKVWIGGTNINTNTASNWLNNSAPVSGDDVIISNGTNQPTLQGNVQLNSLYIRTGATLSLSNRNLSIRSDISNCGTITGNTGMITLNSTAAFAQIQYLSGSGTYNLTDLTINNTFGTSPQVTLNKDVNVSGALLLTSGIVNTTATNILALATTATSSSGSATSFISGPMSKVGNTDFVFPVGKGTFWRRTALTNITASSTFRAEYFNSAFTSSVPVNSPLNNVSIIEYWQVDRLVGAGNANLSLYWESASASGITNCPDLTIARWNGASWDERAGSTLAGSSCSGAGTGTVTTTAVVTAFSPFTFGSKLSSVNPLPIELTDFINSCENGKNHISWSTASEHNSAYFVLERSADALSWKEIKRINAAGNSSSARQYDYLDDLVSEETMYYQLTEVDRDMSKKVLGVISNRCDGVETNFELYPNPASSELNLNFQMVHGNSNCVMTITDNLGRVVESNEFLIKNGRHTVKLPIFLEPGIYFVSCVFEGASIKIKKLVIQ